jgi:hypothetical protein
MPSLDSIVARIKGRSFTDTNALAREMASAISALARQPSFARGIARNEIADVQGGTTLGVGDPSAGHPSSYLVQNPQTGLPPSVGGGLYARRQTRIEIKTHYLPAMVMSDVAAGATSFTARVKGDEPKKSTDPVTGVEIVGDALSGMTASPGSFVGNQYTVSTSGLPFAASGTGLVPPNAGDTIQITLAQQWEVATTWTKRNKKWVPVTTRVLKSETAHVANGFLSN